MNVDWSELFAFDTPFLEIVVRGTLVYLALVAMMRFGRNRGMGSLGVSDMLVIIIIADASQNAIAGEYKSISDGLLLVGVILFWDYVINYATARLSFLEKLMERPTINLIKDGQYQYHNMRREFVTKEELQSQLRINGIDDVKQVKRACLEDNGEVSVIKVDE